MCRRRWAGLMQRHLRYNCDAPCLSSPAASSMRRAALSSSVSTGELRLEAGDLAPANHRRRRRIGLVQGGYHHPGPTLQSPSSLATDFQARALSYGRHQPLLGPRGAACRARRAARRGEAARRALRREPPVLVTLRAATCGATRSHPSSPRAPPARPRVPLQGKG
eukprot:scaffold1504_cov417-Prasinococcus_capsulatus_cf.AAC.38